MFGKLKDKLQGWFKSSKEKIEEDAELVETKEKPDKEKPSKKPKQSISEKELEKADEIIEKAKKEKTPNPPLKYEETTKEYKPDLEKISKEVKQIEIETKHAKQIEKEKKDFNKELKKADEIIEKAKQEHSEQIPTEFNVGAQKYEPDLEKIKQYPETETPSPKETPTKPEQKKSFFSRIKSSFTYKISEEEFKEIFEDLEMLLLENNVALEVVEDIETKLAEKLIGREINQKELEQEIKTELKNTLNEILIEPDNPLDAIKLKTEKPFVILFFGINGTGKTTSIAKITHHLKQAGLSVALAAGDTFRAASIEQLSEHAEKLKVPIIKQGYGADPAAVGFDAIKYAKNHNIDVVLIDTAGRMHTKANLMEELKKIEKVTNPDLKIFVAESIAGNDATEQAKTFHEALEIDGTILSKADIDEKGGTIISISHVTNKPIFFLGKGQNYEDIELFNKQKFIEQLGL